MIFTKEDIAYLKECGNDEEDIEQIERATNHTKFELDGVKISQDKAIGLLGRKKFISGMMRCAFHASAVRETNYGGKVYFDCYKWLFGDK